MSKQKILIFGGNGLVGSRLVELSNDTYDFAAPGSKEVDITKLASVEASIGAHRPDLVVHLAAYTDVTKAESECDNEQGDVWQINVQGTKNVVVACQNASTKLVYISTDFVFNGQQGPYAEDDPVMQSSLEGTWYAWTKRVAEGVVKDQYADKSLILRIAYPFRAKYERKPDFLRKILNALAQGAPYPFFADQMISPTFIDDFAMAFQVLQAKNATGIYHIACDSMLSPYEAAVAVAQTFGYNPTIVKQSTLDDFVASKADDPNAKLRYANNTSLSIAKINGMLAGEKLRMHSFVEALAITKEQGV